MRGVSMLSLLVLVLLPRHSNESFLDLQQQSSGPYDHATPPRVNSKSLRDRRTLCRLLFTIVGLSLHIPQLTNNVSHANGKLFDGLGAFASTVTQVFAQQQLGLAQYSCQRIVYFVANVGHEIDNLVEPQTILRCQVILSITLRA